MDPCYWLPQKTLGFQTASASAVQQFVVVGAGADTAASVDADVVACALAGFEYRVDAVAVAVVDAHIAAASRALLAALDRPSPSSTWANIS